MATVGRLTPPREAAAVTIETLPSGRFRASVQIRGRRHRETFATRAAAETWEAITRGRGLEGRLGSAMTVRAYADVWLAGYANAPKATRTGHADNLRVHLLPRLGHLPIGQVRATHVAACLDAITAAVSPARAENALRTLRAMFNAAVDDEVVAVTPVKRKHNPRRTPTPKVPLEQAEARALLDELDGWHHACALLLLATGARFGEIAGLTPHDLDGDEVIIRRRVYNGTVRGTTKNYRHRRVRLPEMTRPAITRLLDEAMDPDPIPELDDREVDAELYARRWLVQTSLGNPANRSAFGKALKAAATAAGITKRVHPHLLRHTYVSWMIGAGHSADLVAQWIGDKPETVRAVYAHMLEGSSAPAADVIDGALG